MAAAAPGGRPTWAVPFDATRPARDQLAPDPRDGVASVTVADPDGNDYDPVGDLLGSSPQDAHLVVEVEDDGTATLRFGDGTYGREPFSTGHHEATCRHGHGAVGNVGPEAISELHPPVPGVGVSNPVAARGGATRSRRNGSGSTPRTPSGCRSGRSPRPTTPRS